MKVNELAKVSGIAVKQIIEDLNEKGYNEVTHHNHDVSPEQVAALGITLPKKQSNRDENQIHFWSSKAEKHSTMIVEDGVVTTVRFSDSKIFLDRRGKTAKGLLENKSPDIYVVRHSPYETDAECDGFRGYLYGLISPDGEVTSVGMSKVKALLTKSELMSKTLAIAGPQYIDRLVGLIVRTRSIERMEFK